MASAAKSEIRNQKSEIRNQKSEIRNQKTQPSRNPTFEVTFSALEEFTIAKLQVDSCSLLSARCSR